MSSAATRAGARDARLVALRAQAVGTPARRHGDHDKATRHQDLADSSQALHDV
jgi:hypothetical protein